MGLGLIVLLAIFHLSGTVFDSAVAIVLLFAAWEWSVLASAKTIFKRIVYLIATLALIYLSQYIRMTVLIFSCIFWLFALYLVLQYPNVRFKNFSKIARCIIGFFVIVPFWVSVALLHQQKPSLLLLMLLVVTLADSGAYFVGRQYGKKKIAPVISPKKTVEGLLSGIILGGFSGMVYAFIISYGRYEQIVLFILSFVMVMVAFIGDLFESMVKRECGVKDSGSILPGHGGILDRMDSLFASFPIFVLVLLAFGLITL